MTFTFAIGDQLNQLPNEMPNDVKTILHDVETVVETQEVIYSMLNIATR